VRAALARRADSLRLRGEEREADMIPSQQPQPADGTRATLRERRAWLRFECDLKVTCRARNPRKEVGWIAQVRDISQGGVGLLLRHRFRPGTEMLVELRGAEGQPGPTCPIRVVRAEPALVDGHAYWVLGCVFVTPLSEEEMQQLL
jgi:hypothetical protein